MNIIIDNVEQFKIFFDVVYDMASESVELQLFPERMVCAMLDRTKTRFFHVEYDASFFDEYDVEKVGSIVVAVTDIHNLLKLTNKKDTLHLTVDDPYLKAKVISPTGNERFFEFVLPNDEVASPAPPQVEFPVVVDVDVGDLKQSVKDIKLVGTDLFIFNVNDDVLTLMSNNESSTKYSNAIKLDDAYDNVQSMFTLDYVAQMLKFEKISKTVTLKLSTDMPIFYTFEDRLMGVVVNGMIAPRISEE